jgi:hypothetical protein
LTPTSSCQVSGETPVVALVRRMRTTWGRATKAPVTAPTQPRTSTNKIKTFCSPGKPLMWIDKPGGNNVTGLCGFF